MFEIQCSNSICCPALLLAVLYVFNTNFSQSLATFYWCLDVMLLGCTSGPVISSFFLLDCNEDKLCFAFCLVR